MLSPFSQAYDKAIVELTAAFDKGETFSGIPYDLGLKAVDRLKGLFPNQDNLAPVALTWPRSIYSAAVTMA